MPTRRILRSVAHNLLDSLFSGRYSLPDGDMSVYLEQACRLANVDVVRIDLLDGTIDPSAAGTPGLQRLAGNAVERLQDLLAGVGLPPTSLRSGSLTYRAGGLTVTLEDDLGRQHAFECPAAWLRPTPAPRRLPPRSLPKQGRRTETPVTRLLDWLEQFLPRLG
jgi:hypothetical protein